MASTYAGSPTQTSYSPSHAQSSTQQVQSTYAPSYESSYAESGPPSSQRSDAFSYSYSLNDRSPLPSGSSERFSGTEFPSNGYTVEEKVHKASIKTAMSVVAMTGYTALDGMLGYHKIKAGRDESSSEMGETSGDQASTQRERVSWYNDTVTDTDHSSHDTYVDQAYATSQDESEEVTSVEEIISGTSTW
nr:uncharacterized protein CI109_005847 [Kwoniella shandongensis]KAA5525824.1 hypothetical protein CI109_005847 [Kwoniella shandongensis]